MKAADEHLMLPGPAGQLEALLSQPEKNVKKSPAFVIICHPHPLHGGTMHNKVVTTVAKAYLELGITTLRFNYRGVGASEGHYGNYQGETEDALFVINWMKSKFGVPLWMAGFSFGAFIAANATTQTSDVERLLTIAPAIYQGNFERLAPISCPWLVIQGEKDEIVDPKLVYQWFSGLQANKRLVKMPETSHFFHRKLIDLKRCLLEEYGIVK